MANNKKVKDTDKPLDALFKQMRSKHGAESLMLLSKDQRAQITHSTSTGLFNLDEATGWGLPGGRIVELFGPESGGKTTAAMAMMIENHRNGGINIVFDAEGTFDADRFTEMGGDPESVIVAEVTCLENFYDKLKLIMKWAEVQEIPSCAVILIVVDTITTVMPKAVLELKDDETVIGAQARVNSLHLPGVDQSMPGNTCLLLLNQIRDKMGAASWNADGNIDTPGGHVLKHHASVRILFKPAGQIDNGKTKDAREIIGIKTAFKVVKNKTAPPLRKGEFRIMFDQRAADNVDATLNWFVKKGLVQKGTQGKFTISKKSGDLSFKATEFAGIMAKFPKWTQSALDSAFEVPHKGISLDRYLSLPETDEPDDDDSDGI